MTAPTNVRLPMVGWYDPPVLARSAWLLSVANIFGRHSDTRLIEALATQPQGVFDYSGHDAAFWFDYVSDVGDGWNPTYAVAHALARATLSLADASGAPVETCGGQILVFGGDQVYPYPGRDAYVHRTETPYARAFDAAGRRPDVYAVPGNHDWYDSLVSFARTFCRPERGFAGGRTRQTRSYFALQLPGRWWLLGIDLQLGADFDEPQIRYFRDVAARMTDPAHIILCVPEPQWIYAENYPDDRSYSGEVLEYFEREILQRPIAVFLTGDLHFYKRHENAAGVQKIVAGGGGAFLHPTHAPRLRTLQGGFRQRACYPPPAVSRRLVWRNLLFPALNPRYLPIPATLYTLSAWFASASLTSADIGSIDRALRAAINGAVRDPFNGLWLMTFVTAFVFFTDTHSRIYRISGGIAHALAHLFAAFGLGWLAVQLTTKALGLRFGDLPQMLLSAALTFVGGGIAGALILGVYLLVSWRVFGRHANEAFSSLRIQDYKHWLRGCVDPDGRLRLFAIAVDRVPRRWKRRKSGADRALEPQDGAAGTPRLIEWLRLQPRGGGQYAVDGVDERGRRYRRGSTSNDAPAKGIR